MSSSSTDDGVSVDDRVAVGGVGEGYVASVTPDVVTIDFVEVDHPELTVPKGHVGTARYEIVGRMEYEEPTEPQRAAPAATRDGDGYGGSETVLQYGTVPVGQGDLLRDTQNERLVVVKRIEGRKVTVVDVTQVSDDRYMRRPSTKRAYDWPTASGRFIPIER